MSPRFLSSRRAARRAFTLLELLCVVAILALLANLSVPVLQSARHKAQSVACGSNLRQIGLSLGAYVADNNNTYPKIEGDPSNPIYQPQDNALPSMIAAFQPYGLTTNCVKCPSDTLGDDGAGQTYFSHRTSSYFWRPMLDDEVAGTTVVYVRGQVIPVASSRVAVATDWAPFHYGRANRLYGDGHVKFFLPKN